MRVGTVIAYRLRVHGVPVRWVSRIEAWGHERTFVDRQLRRPYRLWHHRHDFEPRDGGTLVADRVHYGLPVGPLGEIAHELIVRRDLETIFAHRHAQVSEALG